jgi:hypothetical protein
MKLLKWFGVLVLLLIVVYFLGPQPATPVYTTNLPILPAEADALENYILTNESRHKLKPDNEARILWLHDSLKEKTEYALVYLHGFSASQEEGDPLHYELAQKFGCNLYLSRLDAHGIDTINPLANFTALGYWNSAKEAFAIGRQLGKR